MAIAVFLTRAENGVVRGIAISMVLALAMSGGMLIPFGPAGASSPGVAAMSHAIPAQEARVDINRASVAELMKVPGMTSSWAGRIVRFRPYRAKSDLLQRGVLPSEVYDRIKDYVVARREKK